MLKACVGVHRLLIPIAELIQRLGVALPEKVDAVTEALKAAHGLAADNIGRQHALCAALVAQQQGHTVGVRQTEIADRVLLYRDRLHIAEGIEQPGQINAEDLAHAAGAGVADKEILIVLPRVPVGQILPDVIDIMHRLAERCDLLLDILRFAPVEHGGGEEERQLLFGSLGHILGVAVPDKVQLGKDRQAVVQQLADDGSVGQRRRADQRGVRVRGGHCLGDGRVGLVRQRQLLCLGAAALGCVNADDLYGGINALGQPGAAFAHAA